MSVVIEATHPSPIWRRKSDFIIGVEIDPAGTDVKSEQLWARRLGDHEFEICCIPFFAYDLALGDRVATDSDFTVTNVTVPSGRYVFRVHLEAGRQENASGLEEWLTSQGLLFEWSSPSLVSIDAPDLQTAEALGADLMAREQRGELLMETGRQ